MKTISKKLQKKIIDMLTDLSKNAENHSDSLNKCRKNPQTSFKNTENHKKQQIQKYAEPLTFKINPPKMSRKIAKPLPQNIVMSYFPYRIEKTQPFKYCTLVQMLCPVLKSLC